jgi:hypothetical protein
MTVPDGAQLSEDGKYWWDGADWQPVPEDAGESAEVGQLSDDGQWKWDGSQWQPVDGEGGGGDGLHEALTSQGFEIAPEAADTDYIKQVYEHVSDWYGSLSDAEKTVVDALSKEGADNLLADPEVGVVAADDPLITAFAGTDKTLGESLEATGQALEQAQA